MSIYSSKPTIMNDINKNKKNQENITQKSESSTSEDLSKTLLTPDQKMDKLMEGMQNMTNGVTQTIELFKQMIKVQIETTTTTNNMIKEEKEMLKEMMMKLMESNTKQSNSMKQYIAEQKNEIKKSIAKQSNTLNKSIARQIKREKHEDIVKALQSYSNITETMKQLLRKISISGNINEKTEKGNTLLHLATISGYCMIEEALTKHPDIDLNIKDNTGNTAIMFAAKTWDRKKTISTLINEPNIDVNLQDNEGNTALIRATKSSYSEEGCILIDKSDININLQDNNGNTALLRAIKKWNINIAKKLIKHPNIDLNIQNKNGITALMLAIKEWSTEIADLIKKSQKQ